jgi:hypothetical protein
MAEESKILERASFSMQKVNRGRGPLDLDDRAIDSIVNAFGRPGFAPRRAKVLNKAGHVATPKQTRKYAPLIPDSPPAESDLW